MSYRSSLSQPLLNNTYYRNNIVSLDTSEPDSIASIDYVNEEALNINDNINNLNSTITSLQNQINAINTSITTLENSIVRITGTIFIGLTSTAPEYSLYCDGSSYLISDYQDLFNKIGYAYGGSGTSFNVPNMKNHYLLGGNGSLNGVSASNLFSGNGQSGSISNYLVSGSCYPQGRSFPMLVDVPIHQHNIIDNGHFHGVGDGPTAGGFSVATTSYITDGGSGNPTPTTTNFSNISVQFTGTNIQSFDLYSGLAGINITMPFISCNFFINT
jgi:microcystin-dependent protein